MRFWTRSLALFTSCLGLAAACSSGESTSICPEGENFLGGHCMQDLGVAVNGVGFLPQRTKRAVLGGSDRDYRIVELGSGETVLEGKAEGPVQARDTRESVSTIDFTELSTAGTYRIETGSGLKSAAFVIATRPIEEALHTAMLGMYGYRCGEEVEFEHEGATFGHEACHLEEASLSRLGMDGTRDDTGGWHDAGDYGKYVRNGAFAVAFLLAAYEQFPEVLKDREFDLPERGGALPDMLDEARVEVEWLLKTQFSDGSFAHKVTKLNFEANVMPDADTGERFFFSTSTASTADAVAVLAQSARIYDEFDSAFASTCLEAARRGQEFLDEHPEEIQSDQEGAVTGTYGSAGDQDERLWAFAELWQTTGEEDYLDAFEALAPELELRFEFDWPDTRNLAFGTYLLSKREGRSSALVEALAGQMGQSALQIAESALDDVYARGPTGYYWGSNGVVARTSYNLAVANALFPNPDFADAITASLDYLLGQNPFSRSFVTGMGANPVRFPHHRPSIADAVGAPWPGLLIGGPHAQTGAPNANGVDAALNWEDEAANYWHNEVAINWSTALIYALTAALATENTALASCWPDSCFVPPSDGAGGAGGGGN